MNADPAGAPTNRRSWVAMALLMLASASLAQRLILAEMSEHQLQRLQNALQVKEQLVDQLQDAGALLPIAASDTANRLAELSALLADETALIAQNNAMATLVPAAIGRLAARQPIRGPADRQNEAEANQLLRAAILSAQALDRSLRATIATARKRELHAWRWSLLIAAGFAGAGVALLLRSLRREGRRARYSADRAALVSAELKAIYDAVPIGLALVEDTLRIRGANPCFAQLALTDQGRAAADGTHQDPDPAASRPDFRRRSTDPQMPDRTDRDGAGWQGVAGPGIAVCAGRGPDATAWGGLATGGIAAESRTLSRLETGGTILQHPAVEAIPGGGTGFATAARDAPALGGLLVAEALPQLASGLVPLLQAALASGEGLPGQEIEALGADGVPRRYFIAAEPVHAALQRGALSLVLMDVTERASLDVWRSEVVAELNHRVKNTLATVQSLAAQTLRGAGHDPQRFAADFSARLGALSRSHELLAAIGWVEATIQATVTTALAPWTGAGHLAMAGPPGLPLRPAQSQALVIALTEMAGNSVRFGAMGSSGGRVMLHWEALPDGLARMVWQERGGPPLYGPPPRRGFGMRFLERGLAHDLGRDARVQLRFEPAGFTCEICFRPGDMPSHLSGIAA